MTLRHLKIFKTVCEESSMTNAAKKLFITQPSVSQAISELEDFYGNKLFNRASKKLYITKSGIQLLSYAEKILGLSEEVQRNLSNKFENKKQKLRVGATITVGETFFSHLISQFLISNFNSEIISVVNNLESIVNMVINDKLDIGIIAVAALEDKRLNTIAFHKDKLVLACSKSHPLYNKDKIGIDEMLSYRHIVREDGSDVRDLIERQNADLNICGIYNSYNAILKSVKHNLGVAVIPRVFIPKEDNSIHAIDIENPDFQREYFIITNKEKEILPEFKDFINHCFEYRKYLEN